MFEFTQYPEQTYIEMKIMITEVYSEKYGTSLDDAIDLFVEKGIYEMLDEGRDMYIMHMYPYMAEFIHDWIYPRVPPGCLLDPDEPEQEDRRYGEAQDHQSRGCGGRGHNHAGREGIDNIQRGDGPFHAFGDLPQDDKEGIRRRAGPARGAGRVPR